jgi:hypothetical protein
MAHTNLRIPSHMSGEQYITKAALIASSEVSVTVPPMRRTTSSIRSSVRMPSRRR